MICVCVCLCACVCVCACMYVCACVCVYIYNCIYIYIYVPRGQRRLVSRGMASGLRPTSKSTHRRYALDLRMVFVRPYSNTLWMSLLWRKAILSSGPIVWSYRTMGISPAQTSRSSHVSQNATLGRSSRYIVPCGKYIYIYVHTYIIVVMSCY